MKEETVTVCTDGFETLGLPRELIEYVASREYPKRYSKRFGLQLLLAILAIMGFLVLFSWGGTALLEYLKQARVAQLEQPYRYQHVPVPSAILLFLSGVTGLVACAGILERFTDARRLARGIRSEILEATREKEYGIFRTLEGLLRTHAPGAELTRSLYRDRFRKLAGLSVEEQLAKIASSEERIMAMVSKGFYATLLFAVPFVVLDFNHYDLADESGATFGDYFSLSRTTHLWQHAEAVEFGCVVSERGYVRLHYEVQWPGGESYNLLDGKLGAMDIDLADLVSRRLMDAGTERRVASFTSDTDADQPKAVDPACASTLQELYPAEQVRKLRRLIETHSARHP